MKQKIIISVVLVLMLVSLASAVDQEYLNKVKELEGDFNLFYSSTCPHCHEEMAYLKTIEPNFSDVNFHYFEVTTSQENYELFKAFAEYHNTTTKGVPRTFVNGKCFIGFDPGEGELQYSLSYDAYMGYANVITGQINEISQNTIVDELEEQKISLENFYIFGLVLLYLPTYFLFKKKIKKNDQNRRYWISGLFATFLISFFVFILTVPESLISGYAQKLPFPIFVFILALADGFNPCAFTVLFILLSLLTYTKKKSNMKLVGVIFIVTSAIMYFIFIMLMIFAGSFFIEKWGELILKILGGLIIIAGIINLKDYLWFQKGVSLTMSKEEKFKIVKKAKKIVHNLNEKEKSKKNLFKAIIATIFLAIGVNIVELGCTAILPTVYMSSLLTKYGTIFGFNHVVWTGFYSFIYVIPLFAILFNFIYTFKSERISESQGRILKLVSGIFMLVCGIIMVLKPGLLMFG